MKLIFFFLLAAGPALGTFLPWDLLPVARVRSECPQRIMLSPLLKWAQKVGAHVDLIHLTPKQGKPVQFLFIVPPHAKHFSSFRKEFHPEHVSFTMGFKYPHEGETLSSHFFLRVRDEEYHLFAGKPRETEPRYVARKAALNWNRPESILFEALIPATEPSLRSLTQYFKERLDSPSVIGGRHFVRRLDDLGNSRVREDGFLNESCASFSLSFLLPESRAIVPSLKGVPSDLGLPIVGEEGITPEIWGRSVLQSRQIGTIVWGPDFYAEGAEERLKVYKLFFRRTQVSRVFDIASDQIVFASSGF